MVYNCLLLFHRLPFHFIDCFLCIQNFLFDVVSFGYFCFCCFCFGCQIQKNYYQGNSLAVPWLGLRALTAGSLGSVPSQGAKIPQAVRHGKKQNKTTPNPPNYYQDQCNVKELFPCFFPMSFRFYVQVLNSF